MRDTYESKKNYDWVYIISFPLYGCGNLPLQGTKLLVRMAKRRSLGESIIRQPTMPAALQPKPMHMVSTFLH